MRSREGSVLPEVPCKLMTWPGRSSGPLHPRVLAVELLLPECDLPDPKAGDYLPRLQPEADRPLTGFSVLPSKDLLVLSA